MIADYFLEHTKISKVLIEDMFQVKPGETIAITGDSGSDRDLADALAEAVFSVGGKPLILWTPKAAHDGHAGEIDLPAKALTAALCKVDAWIEIGSSVMLYSHIWETAFSKNKKLRYLVLGNSSVQSLMRTFVGFDVDVLNSFLLKVKAMTEKSKTIRIVSDNGTDVSYETDANYMFDIDSGDYSKPIFGTAPGYVNVVPKTGSMNGTIVFDLLMNTNVYDTKNSVEFKMKNGTIETINGGEEAENFKSYIASFHDPNMYKISHNMFGFNPGVRALSGEIVEDERIWGGVDFGFGHTSPMDMPPYGQPAKSHFDGVVEKVSIFLDDIQIVDNGEVCHPILKPLAEKLLNN
ncbi:aminopeptidase [Seonamhaeicola maritimus]|uniref:Aminopeptidase n=1 Tax=Seonamhaeicola maritimus TaxID=2591822 RepID=A0A5C7GKE4_9FLAO|nr:aminopeptidase [Seonamhaeicola maritimus]TXG38695.1 aminopeptidase [Seonamhaeicola maritimus]